MARCIYCDASSTGMSMFNLERPFAKHFHETNDGFACSDCWEAGEEVLDDWNFEETMNEEEESAFEYE